MLAFPLPQSDANRKTHRKDTCKYCALEFQYIIIYMWVSNAEQKAERRVGFSQWEFFSAPSRRYLERIQVLKNNFTRAHVEAEKLNAKDRIRGVPNVIFYLLIFVYLEWQVNPNR